MKETEKRPERMDSVNFLHHEPVLAGTLNLWLWITRKLMRDHLPKQYMRIWL